MPSGRVFARFLELCSQRYTEDPEGGAASAAWLILIVSP